jgi:hypothetical protein
MNFIFLNKEIDKFITSDHEDIDISSLLNEEISKIKSNNNNNNNNIVALEFIIESKINFFNSLDKFLNYFNKTLHEFFINENIRNKILCEQCKENINYNLHLCIINHNVNENFHNEISYIFERLIHNLKCMYNKDIKIMSHINKFSRPTLFNQIVSRYILLIAKVIKIHTYLLLEKFKENLTISEENLVNPQFKHLLQEISLYKVYEETIEESLKYEIIHKIGEFIKIHDKSILNEIIR